LRFNLNGVTNEGLQTLCSEKHKRENLRSLFLAGLDCRARGCPRDKADPYATSISLTPISRLSNLQKFGIYHKRPMSGMNDFATVDSKLSKLKYVCWQTAEHNGDWNDEFDRQYMGTREDEELYVHELNATRIAAACTSIKVDLWTARQWKTL